MPDEVFGTHKRAGLERDAVFGADQTPFVMPRSYGAKRQVLVSTMHCVAVDGIGIFAGAVVASCIFLNCWPKRKPNLRHIISPSTRADQRDFLAFSIKTSN